MSEKVTAQILLIYTGGTIGMVKDYRSDALKAFDFDNIKKKIPELQILDCGLNTVSFEEPIDSSNMDPLHWRTLAGVIEEHYASYDGFVVLTGTDTMSYTASVLSFMLDHLDKPVVFTGSQLPIGDLRTDAKENLITAIQVAASRDEKGPLVREVALYFEYKLYRANRTTKISSEQFEAFDSPNFPVLGESGVHLTFNEALRVSRPKTRQLAVHYDWNPNITVLKLFPGITQQSVKHLLTSPGLKGVIMETFGAGNAPTAAWFIEAIEEAIQNGLKVVNVTQCIKGRVFPGLYETSRRLDEIGVINGKDITTESAIAKMGYLLSLNLDNSSFKKSFESSLRGEIT